MSKSSPWHIEFHSDSSLMLRVTAPFLTEASAIILSMFQHLSAIRSQLAISNLHPAYASLLIDFDPSQGDPQLRLQSLQEWLQVFSPESESTQAREPISIALQYGGVDGPDLAEVARHCQMSESEVTRSHCEAEYHVAFLGFAPGFPYLLGLPSKLTTPRKNTPRLRVPAGAVAIAGAQAGIYPAETPAGWQWIGRTSQALFDPAANPPSLLQPGDRVHFSQGASAFSAPLPSPCLTSPAGLEVLRGGFFSTVQDLGREGWAHLGVSTGGAADPVALQIGNAVVGNKPGAAAIELTQDGGEFLFLRDGWFTLTGVGGRLEPYEIAPWTAIPASAGQRLVVGPLKNLFRAYLCVHGGIDVPILLGSRSSLISSRWGGFKGRCLQAGDRLGFGSEEDAAPCFRRASSSAQNLIQAPQVLRYTRGPQWDWFSTQGRRRLSENTFTVSQDLNRLGIRLQGPAIERSQSQEMISEGTAGGALQVTPEGQVMILFCEQRTTGGYPKIGHVIRADWHRLGQLAPEASLRFAEVSLAEAWTLNRELKSVLTSSVR